MIDKNNKHPQPTDVKELGITVKKSDDFSEWFTQSIIKSELADYSAVSGCIVYRPDSYLIWEKLTRIVDEKLKELGVKNSYFPLFIPEKLLMKEATHLEGFSPEVAWVTHAGDSKLDERLAVRPTSETIMYDSYSRWIRSWRDLPLKLAQWNNVVRWEFKHPVPFLRGREFLWVEGHTVFSSKQEAIDEGQEIVALWEDILKKYLATAFFTGKKSKKETFAGAEYTISLESILPNGKAIQGPDFHHDGQIFSKAYNIKFLNKNGEQEFAYQNTWAISTRMLGVMLGIHGDDNGLIIPPRIAINHVVIVPILFDDSMDKILKKCDDIQKELSKVNYHGYPLGVIFDNRNYKPGYKFNYWELKGVPVRIELGPKDLDKDSAILVRRDTREKISVKISEIPSKLKELLDDIQLKLYNNSLKTMNEHIVTTNDFDSFKKHIDERKTVYSPFCNNPECEDNIKSITGAKTLNAPLNQNNDKSNCIACGAPTDMWFYFGKSY